MKPRSNEDREKKRIRLILEKVMLGIRWYREQEWNHASIEKEAFSKTFKGERRK